MSSSDDFIISRFFRLPWGVIFLISLITMMGVAMLYSAAQGSLEPWAGRHFSRFVIGFAVMLIVGLIHIEFWFRYAYVIYAAGMILLILVEAMGFIGMGAQRWLNVGGMNFQPSEVMKIAVTLVLARYFHCLHLNNLQSLRTLALPLLLIAMPVVLILKQPNLGTASIITFMSIAIFFAAGISIKKFIFAGIAGVSCLPVIWHFMHDYQKQRVMTFLEPETDPLGSGYNIIQSKIAIGSGGFFGKGFMQGSQSQLNFLPEKQTDFVFTMLTEEFGFVGGFTIIALYAILIVLGIRIANNCQNHFGKLVCFGVVTMLFLHVFINMAMTMGMIPVVGVPLPLLSYGGSNLIAALAGFGFLLGAHVHNKDKVGRVLNVS